MYEIGDKLRIRQWEDMADEFRVEDEGIRFSHSIYFANGMRYLCGEEFTVSRIYNNPSLIQCYNSEEGCGDDWCITCEMLEPIEEPVDITHDELMSILNG